jgi:DNA-binding NarL/FixJ family response regulator
MQPGMDIAGFAENGLDCLFKSRSLEPDIVIMDSGMPVFSGLDAVSLIHEAVPDVKIIIYSLNVNDEYIHKSLRTGAVGYVFKLSPSRDVIDAIRAVSMGNIYISPGIKRRVLDTYKTALSLPECRYNLLSTTEQRIFRLMVEGHSPREIAARLLCNESTIGDVKKKITEKIQLHDDKSLMRYAEEIGILSPENWA